MVYFMSVTIIIAAFKCFIVLILHFLLFVEHVYIYCSLYDV